MIQGPDPAIHQIVRWRCVDLRAELVRAALPAAAAGRSIEIWFQDEARVGQRGGQAYIWAPLYLGADRLAPAHAAR